MINAVNVVVMLRLKHVISQGLNYVLDDGNMSHPMDSYFMGYHTTLKTSKDYFEALRAARRVAGDITTMIKNYTLLSAVEVFPYRYTRLYVNTLSC
jgi:ribosomal protein L30E